MVLNKILTAGLAALLAGAAMAAPIVIESQGSFTVGGR